MLKFLRQKGNIKKIMWGLAILIIPAFVLWGSGSSIRQKGLPNYAGKIFGKKVSLAQYQTSLQACRNQALLIYGEEFKRAAKYLDLEQQAWERLILLIEAKREKIKVSNKEVIDLLQRMPLFQKEGRFNQEKYNILLDYVFRTSPRDFEEQIREALKLGKLRAAVVDKVALEPEEVENVYKNTHEQAQVFYILIEPQKFSEQIHPAYEELEDYYQKHRSEFRKPEQVNVQYIALYSAAAAAEPDITEEEIDNFYQRHLEQFSVKDDKDRLNTKPLEEVRAQIKESLTRDKIRLLLEEEAWQMSDDITKNAGSFEEVAKNNGLEIKESGFFAPEQAIADIGLSYELLNAAFSLNIGQISKPIETPQGYFIIKLKEKKQPYVPVLEEIKEQVQEVLVRQQSRQLAKQEAEELLAQIRKLIEEEKLDFAKAAQKLSLTVKESEKFSRSSYISGIGQSAEFAQAAFALEPGEVSGLIATSNGYCILGLKEFVPIDQEKFAQEKAEFAQQLLARKKETYYKIWLANLRKKAKLASNIN